MTAARWVLVVCALAAAGEVGLWAAALDRPAAVLPAGVLLAAFLAGPLAFLALLAWRRRTHPAWPRRFLVPAAALAVVGLGVLGWDCYRFHTDPEFRKVRNMNGVVVPLGQWAAVLAVWVVVVVHESREKRAAAK
jgi:hypothetical protein